MMRCFSASKFFSIVVITLGLLSGVRSVQGQYVVHNNLELGTLLYDLYNDPPSSPVSIVGQGNFDLDPTFAGYLDAYFGTEPGSVNLASGSIDVARNTTLTMPLCDFGATGGRITFGELGVAGAVNLDLNTINLGSAAQLRLSGDSSTTHVITANSINIANPNSLYFEGVSVNNAPQLQLNGTLTGTLTRTNNLMEVTASGNVYSANPLAGLDLYTVAQNEGYIGSELAYYQQMEEARQLIMSTGDYTNPAIQALDEIFNGGLKAASFYSAPSAPVNGLTALTVTNNVGAIVLWRQTDEFGDPKSLVASALVRGQSCSPCGKAKKSRSYDLWFQAFNANMDVWSRGRGGASYGVTRNGGVVGINTALGKKSAGGIVFSMSNPHFYDKSERLNLTDFQFGLHLETQLGNDWEAGMYVGGGVQDGYAKRKYTFYDGTYNFRGDYSGNTMSATFMLAKVLRLSKRTALRPTVAIDTEHSWYFGFTENSTQDNRATLDPNASRRHFSKNHYGRTMARIGVMAQTGRNKWGLNGRVFYAPQLGGKDYATSRLTLADGVHQGSVYDMEALPLGRDMIVLGTGGHLFLNKNRTLLIYGDYNANLFKYATTQVVSLGLQKTF